MKPASRLPAAPLALALTLAFAGGSAGCESAGDVDDTDDTVESARPLVVVSVLPQAFIVDRVARGLVSTEVMIPPGASPATYEPTIDKLAAIDRAALYVKVGHPDFPFERAWLDRLVEGRAGLEIVDASAGVPERDGDPHVWLSPAIMRRIARNVHAALVEILPGERGILGENLEILLAEIGSVEETCGETLAPVRGRRFFVFHPAWGYFADAYGLVQVAIEEHGKEPDVHHLADIVDDARAAGVRMIFAQPQMSEASARLVAEEIGAQVVLIDPLAYEWADNLERVSRSIADGAVR
ncbi:MAG: hypothetical protein E4H03_10850 [Myxococcales bacterium]|nr:MAG: hypothetical protein E4H03_10850 [Myxococcales bacterium]